MPASNPDTWFKDYVERLDDFVEDGGLSPLVFRTAFEAAGTVYPQYSGVVMKYINNLEIPGEGDPTNYDYVFERTRQNVVSTWRDLGSALNKGKPELFTLANGDLDTGRDERNRFVFWE